jgi:multidrug efflux pump subunit AcrB
MNAPLGVSGRIAQRFLTQEITPLLALVGLLLGLFAVLVTPREEEPQINVTFANVFIAYPGASAKEVERLIAAPAEQIVSEISGVEHVYSVSQSGMAVLTVRYRVGEDRTGAIVRLYNALYSHQDWMPPNIGVAQPLIKPKGIDDVPIVALTLWTEDAKRGSYDLRRVAHAIETELKRVPDTRDVYTIGGPSQVVRIELDPSRLAAYGLAIDDLRHALVASNASQAAGALVANNEEVRVQAGVFLGSADDVAGLVVGVSNGAPVQLRDVATVRLAPEQPENYVGFGRGPQGAGSGESPAVTVAVAKKPGSNAVEIAREVVQRVDQLRGTFIPEGVNVTVTRNYGETADDKAQKLISKLVFATASVVGLVLITLGRREAVIVGAAVVVTLAATLFASWAWGFTLNRVSLFALIFSIGILVDDAIVVVENIHRHRQLGGRSLLEAIPIAVDEVGGPTILATFTVIAALLPMAFVSGLMGPYMSPIPINASIGMVISLAVAFVITPWLTYLLLRNAPRHAAAHGEDGGRLYALFRKHMTPFLQGDAGVRRRWKLLAAILGLILFSVSLAVFKLVVLKMLPFDNKSEFQVVVDMPEGTALERTQQVLVELGAYLRTVPEVENYQTYAGAASPINFNGLVRQYYLRSGANVGDIQVNLIAKEQRDRQSHDIALSVRAPLVEIAKKFDANIKIVEVPPGPPVQAPLVAEVYGLSYDGQARLAKELRGLFEATPDIHDVDDSIEADAPRWIVRVDQQKAALLGVSQQSAVAALRTVLGGEDVSYAHTEQAKYPVPLRLEYPIASKSDLGPALALRVRSSTGGLVPLADLVDVQRSTRERAIYHKDLLPVTFVTGDVAGALDSPLYGMFELFAQVGDKSFADIGNVHQYLIAEPDDPYRYSVKWDGEWQVTYETFRDMGLAYGVGIVLIYLLVVAQFRSYFVPLIIMVPIPLTVIGVMPGHALLGAKFTATSMIGMIALAGIIVRNSILLVDFINQQVAEGIAFQEAVIRSGAVRAKPIVLTGLAAMFGAFFILDDPIFNGLAIALIFGILVSTLLTLFIIPVMYYAFMRSRFETPTSP